MLISVGFEPVKLQHDPIFSTITYFTYILESQADGRFYIGQTQNVDQRLEKHNKGYSTYTKKFRPWKLIWYQAFETRKEAYQTEQRLKKLKSRIRILNYIENYGVKVIKYIFLMIMRHQLIKQRCVYLTGGNSK